MARPDPSAFLHANYEQDGLCPQGHSLFSVPHSWFPAVNCYELVQVLVLCEKEDPSPSTSAQRSFLVDGVSHYSSGQVLPPSELVSPLIRCQTFRLESSFRVPHGSATMVLGGDTPADQSSRVESHFSGPLFFEAIQSESNNTTVVIYLNHQGSTRSHTALREISWTLL